MGWCDGMHLPIYSEVEMIEVAGKSVYGIVYCIEHIDSGMLYIGQTVRRLSARWSEHGKSSYCPLLYRSIKKYGRSAFRVDILDTADSAEDLNIREVFFIKFFGTHLRRNGYNLREGGSNGKHSEESRKKMSIAVLEAYKNPAFRAKLSAARLGVKHSAEHVAKRSASLIGKKHTDAARKKQSEARKKTWADPELRAKVYAAQIAGKANPEYRAAAAEKSRAIWSDPDRRAAMMKALDATREAGNAARKAAWADPIKKAARLEKIAATRASKRSLITS
jgi:group I intron endonuclease